MPTESALSDLAQARLKLVRLPMRGLLDKFFQAVYHAERQSGASQVDMDFRAHALCGSGKAQDMDGYSSRQHTAAPAVHS
jgi:hypothetical protein